MRKIIYLFTIIMIAITISGCSSESNSNRATNVDNTNNDADQAAFYGEVSDVSGNSVTISVTDGDILSSSDSVIAYFPDDTEMHMVVGDIVQIWYDGEVKETYPAQVEVISYEVVQKGETDEVGNVAEYGDSTAELLNAEFFESDDGTSMVRIYVEYTNTSSDGMYMLESFSVKAFQNDTELADITDINDDESSVCLIQEVKNGESVQGSYVFELSDDSDVEVQIYTPTADEELLAMQIYSK